MNLTPLLEMNRHSVREALANASANGNKYGLTIARNPQNEPSTPLNAKTESSVRQVLNFLCTNVILLPIPLGMWFFYLVLLKCY